MSGRGGWAASQGRCPVPQPHHQTLGSWAPGVSSAGDALGERGGGWASLLTRPPAKSLPTVAGAGEGCSSCLVPSTSQRGLCEPRQLVGRLKGSCPRVLLGEGLLEPAWHVPSGFGGACAVISSVIPPVARRARPLVEWDFPDQTRCGQEGPEERGFGGTTGSGWAWAARTLFSRRPGPWG